MTDRSVNDLNYGHLGLALYDRVSEQWHYGRRPSRERGLIVSILDDRMPVSAATEANHEDPTLHEAPTAKSMERWLFEHYPECQPAVDVLRELLHPSVVDEPTRSPRDPVQGSLLSFGRIADTSRPDARRTMHVYAIPGGPTGSDLRVSELLSERRGWNDSYDIYLQHHDLSHGETSWWIGDGAPILQVVFSPSLSGEPALLAVRLPRCLVILRPSFQKDKVPPHGVKLGRAYEASRIELGPGCRLEADSSGESLFCDVAFSPWKSTCFAAVTSRREWRLYDMGVAERRVPLEATMIQSGEFKSPVYSGDEDADIATHQSPTDAGWARVLWVAANTLILYDCQSLSIHNLNNDGEVSACAIFGKKRVYERILDIQCSTVGTSSVFVLTTLRLLWYQLLQVDENNGSKQSGYVFSDAVSWRHFRDETDHTLRLSLCAMGSEHLAQVYSSKDDMIIYFQFSSTGLSQTIRHSSADPVYLVPPKPQAHAGLHHSPIRSAHIMPIDLQANKAPHLNGRIGSLHRERNVRFFSLTVFRSDLSVQQLLIGISPNQTVPIQPLTWNQVVRLKKAKVLKGDKLSFIVPDEAAQMENQLTRRLPIRSAYSKHWRSIARSQKENPQFNINSTLNWHKIYQLVTSSAFGQEQSTLPNTAEFVDNVRGWMEDEDEPKKREWETLMERFGSSQWEQPDVAAGQFASLLGFETIIPGSDHPRWELKQLSAPQFISFTPQHQALILSSLYDALTTSWIKPLPQAITGQMRLRQERLARQIATEVYLGNVVLAEPPRGPEIVDYALPTLSLDMLGSSQSYLQPSQAQSSQLPTPSATPSLMSGSSFASGAGTTATVLSRLSRIATIHDDTDPPLVAQSMERFLHHWIPGSNPSHYNYMVTLASAAQAASMSPHSRARLERKAAKLLMRQRREAAKAAENLARSSQPQLLVTTAPEHRSSPGPGARVRDAAMTTSDMPESSQGRSMQLPILSSRKRSEPPTQGLLERGVQSQTVPGTFGGRRPPAKKRKTAMAGFR